jgi:hypothetical protein
VAIERETRGKNHRDHRVRPRVMGEQRRKLVDEALLRPSRVLLEGSVSTTNDGAPSDRAVG